MDVPAGSAGLTAAVPAREAIAEAGQTTPRGLQGLPCGTYAGASAAVANSSSLFGAVITHYIQCRPSAKRASSV